MEESEYQLLITHTLNQRKLKWWWRHTVKILNLQMKPEKNVEKRWILREKRILLNLKSRCGFKFSRFNLVKKGKILSKDFQNLFEKICTHRLPYWFETVDCQDQDAATAQNTDRKQLRHDGGKNRRMTERRPLSSAPPPQIYLQLVRHHRRRTQQNQFKQLHRKRKSL